MTVRIILWATLLLCAGTARSQIASISERAERAGFSGVILIHDGSEVLMHRAFGLADREAEAPNRVDTRFPVASITKLFTAVLVLQMSERQEINLASHVSEYLPQFQIEAFKRITIHQLLNHTSGLPVPEAAGDEENDEDLPLLYAKPIDLDEAIRTYLGGPLRSEKDSLHEYNNGDYWVLGRIVEAVAGRPYEQVLAERILAPLGLNNTSYIRGEADRVGLARASFWDRETERLRPNPPVQIENYFAGGALASTAADVLAFTRGLFDGQVLEAASLEQLLRTYPNSDSYGYGAWIRYPEYNRTVPKVVRRYGRIWGYRHLVSRFVDEGITLVVLANNDRVEPTSIEQIVGEELLD